MVTITTMLAGSAPVAGCLQEMAVWLFWAESRITLEFAVRP